MLRSEALRKINKFSEMISAPEARYQFPQKSSKLAHNKGPPADGNSRDAGDFEDVGAGNKIRCPNGQSASAIGRRVQTVHNRPPNVEQCYLNRSRDAAC